MEEGLGKCLILVNIKRVYKLSRKVLFMILGLIPIIIIVITFANFTTSNNVVSNEDIEINILNMEEHGETTLYITAEIVNKSSLDLEKNNIFIQSLDTKDKSTTNIRKSAKNSSKNQQNSDELTDNKTMDLKVKELDGSFSEIPANKSIRIGINLQLENRDHKSLLLVFRSDQIRNENNATKTHYTTLTKELNEKNSTFAD